VVLIFLKHSAQSSNQLLFTWFLPSPSLSTRTFGNLIFLIPFFMAC
jgi:hypothetical protein